jgi:hypothetical protein
VVLDRLRARRSIRCGCCAAVCAASRRDRPTREMSRPVAHRRRRRTALGEVGDCLDRRPLRRIARRPTERPRAASPMHRSSKRGCVRCEYDSEFSSGLRPGRMRGHNRTGVLARPTGFKRADAINIRIPIEGAGTWLAGRNGRDFRSCQVIGACGPLTRRGLGSKPRPAPSLRSWPTVNPRSTADTPTGGPRCRALRSACYAAEHSRRQGIRPGICVRSSCG